MLEKIFWMGVGILIARVVIFNTPDYKTKEAEKINQLRNGVHEIIKKYAPEADDTEVSKDVMSVVTD
jgi:hypothetical protein